MKNTKKTDNNLYYFKLLFGKYTRYTKSFKLKTIPSLKEQEKMIKLYLNDSEFIKLNNIEKFSGFSLEKE